MLTVTILHVMKSTEHHGTLHPANAVPFIIANSSMANISKTATHIPLRLIHHVKEVKNFMLARNQHSN